MTPRWTQGPPLPPSTPSGAGQREEIFALVPKMEPRGLLAIQSRTNDLRRLLVSLAAILTFILPSGICTMYGDAEHITAILGESVVLNCPVAQPETPYIIQWKRQHHKIPIYIWYDGYDPHVEDNYKGRASRVNPDASYGLASLNLTSVRESDQGWYECNVFYLDRTGASDNGTWVHLDVHAPPRFVTTPKDVTYVNIGDSIILNCEAEGTPTPEIMWFRDDKAVTPSESVGIFNDGTELRINKIRDQDIGDYLCVARNAEGRVVHDAKVVIAGGAVIINAPHNLTRQEGERAEFPCEAKALPGNVTVMWKREDVPIDQLSWLDTRSVVRKDGTLVINPTSADDGGFFTCEVSNGIGTPQRASAYLNVEYPARVTYTPTVQYLPFRQQGIIKCHIKSNPPIQFVTWIKDKRLFEPDNEDSIVALKNGSLLITKVNQSHQGRYSCTPYNRHTTAGSSGDMEVLVREPPIFSPRPQQQYHGEVGEDVTLVCGGKGSPTPSVTWRKRDGQSLPRDRTTINGGNLTIKSLKKPDHGFYECEVKNEIMGIVAATQLLVEGTTPHPPYNISTETTPFSVKLMWLPGYPGGRDYDQRYTIWYRMNGHSTWAQIEVKPAGSTSVTIHNLAPETTYEFQVQGKNKLGDGMFSEIVEATTNARNGGPPRNTPPPINTQAPSTRTDKTTGVVIEPVVEGKDSLTLPVGPEPHPPTNVSVNRIKDHFVISWVPPEDKEVPVQYYDIEYKTENDWKKLNEENIVGETSYKVKKRRLKSGKTYYFRVLSKTVTSQRHSQEIKFKVPLISKEKEITAAIVGGILFFIVAIILSVCTVRICNNRKRKKQDKELQSHIFYDTSYNMVACRVGDNRNGGGTPKSPVPLKKVLSSRISSLKKAWVCFDALFLGQDAFDTTDSRTIESALSFRPESAARVGSSQHGQLGYHGSLGHPYLSRFDYSKPLASISRATDGRFILDKDSEEGGFTSTRKPIRCLLKRPVHFIPYSSPHPNEADSQTYIWMDQRQDNNFDHAMWRPEQGIHSGVYHVRTGRTSNLEEVHQRPSRLSLGSGASVPSRDKTAPLDGYQRTPLGYRSPLSPQFGRHFIPDSPGDKFRSPVSRRFRSSSPVPYSNEWSQLAQLASFSEVSSVKQPSSVERSFPSTVLSSLQHSAQRTPSIHELSIAHAYRKELAHQQRLKQQAISPQRELPILTPIRAAPGPRFHVIGAEVHSPPLQQQLFHPHSPGAFHYLDHLPHWELSQRRQPLRDYRPLHSYHDGFVDSYHSHFRGPRPYMFTPPYREILVTNPHISPDPSRHYVNITPRRNIHQRIPGQEPYYLLNPPPPGNQKPLAPLATSSPPRSRPRHVRHGNEFGATSLGNSPTKVPSVHSTKVPEIKTLSKDELKKEPSLHLAAPSDSSSDKPVTYTRERLQEAIKLVRSGLIKNDGRPHSAPILSSSTQDDMLLDRHVSFDTSKSQQYKVGASAPVSQEVSYEQSQEISHEQSPDSSSGFGSKNTSHQQSSSQSGHSASALGLDSTTRAETSEQDASNWDNIPSRPYVSAWGPPIHPPSYDEWLSRRYLSQPGFSNIRIPPSFDARSSNLLMRISEQPPNAEFVKEEHSFDSRGSDIPYQNKNWQNSAVNDPRLVNPERPEFPYLHTIPRKESVDITEPLSINTTHRLPGPSLLTTAPLNQAPILDISVDDHYEFDTVLSPTPGDDSAAVWSRTRIPSGDRGLSDSEIYGTSAGRRKVTQESTEARVAAMKQEFHEYRQRQARRRRSRELESVC